jgi:protoporphyrinogen IX oxidase
VTPEARTRTVRAIVSLVITAALIGFLVWLLPERFYHWVLAFHLMAVIAWMAGMFYLPRLFVYHCGAEPGSRQSETFKLMEYRLLTQIINPAMVATWVAGVWLMWMHGLIHAGWMQAKLAFVVLLSGYHGMLAAYVRHFAADRNRHSERYYRVINEVPTVLMMAIVILAIVKPF